MIDQIFSNWLLLCGIFGLALISPGPDFVLSVKNSLTQNRMSGLMTASGFAAGVAIHVTYTLGGLALLITQSYWIFMVIKYAGAAYLIYLGVQALRSKGFHQKIVLNGEKLPEKSLWGSFFEGFMTNLLNPKAAFFFISIFSQFLSPDSGISIKLIYGMTCIMMTFLWFSLVSIFLSQKYFQDRYKRASRWIDRLCGIALCGLGLKIIFSKSA